jgi:hypothetical protein
MNVAPCYSIAFGFGSARSVLDQLGFDASVEGAWSLKWGVKKHTRNEVIIENERYILDAFYRYCIHVC